MAAAVVGTVAAGTAAVGGGAPDGVGVHTGVGVQHGGPAIIMDPRIAAGCVCAFCVTIIGWCGAPGDAGEIDIRKTAPQGYSWEAT